MKRIRVDAFGGPEVLVMEEAGDPRPGAHEVLIRVKAAGVNPYETYARAGTYGARNPKLPYTPGSDAAGVVEAVGEGVVDLSPGERVFTMGTLTGSYAELALCERARVQILPDNTSFAQGAGLFVPYVTAYRALFQLARIAAGETLLVHGASGGVGIAALQFARAAGLTVIGTAGSERGLELVARQGAHHAVNHHTEGYQQRILDRTEGRGADAILEVLANVNLGSDLKMLAAGGRVVVIGSRGDATITPRDLMARDASIMAMTLWNVPTEGLRRIGCAIRAGLEQGFLHPVVGMELPLAQAAEAHRRVAAPGAFGKTVLVP
ncbi:MAG TPA: NADPH:quinone reductase [Steroidobacteraceae bacterium]|nr:NADPH:quinone reductase [Steroidobacteraceae bacterium]